MQTKQVRGIATNIRVDNGFTIIRYHKTDVVQFNESQIILDNGGWHTATTAARMNQSSNQFNLGYRVYRVKGVMMVDYKGQSFAICPKIILQR